MRTYTGAIQGDSSEPEAIMKSAVVRILIMVGAIVALPVIGHAQEATVSGTVTDTTGGTLPGVTVRAVHEATGNIFETVTDERGAYRMAVRIGIYRLTAELTGFASVTRTVELLVGQQGVVNLQMGVSAVQETVTVTGEAPLIDVTSSSVGGNIDPRQVSELPVNGRNWIDLSMLAPGSRSNAVAETPIPGDGRGTYQLNVDGQQVTNYIVFNRGNPRYSRDAIAEFELVSNRFDATQGRSIGVQVNVVTKSGTNTPGGTFSGYFRDDRLNAADFVAGRVLPYSNQQLSGTFGGPIRRDRVHFFGHYEYEREPLTSTFTTPYPRFNRDLTGTRREHKGGGRLDLQFSPQTRLSLRGSKWAYMLPYSAGSGTITPANTIGTDQYMTQLFAVLTQVLSNRSVNEIKGGYAGVGWDQYTYIKNPKATVTGGLGMAMILLRGLAIGTGGFNPQSFKQRSYSIRDDLTYSFTAGGRHDVKLGGEYIYTNMPWFFCNVCNGELDARGGNVPANIEDLFPDLFDASTWNLAPLSPITVRWRQAVGRFSFTTPRHVYGAWMQDDWAITPRLTLNLGFRYDLTLNAFANETGIPPFLPSNRPEDTNNVAPRLGFVFSLTSHTVIRGGFGKYFGDVINPHFTQGWAHQIIPETPNDGRPDFAVNPYNGPTPTFESIQPRLCSTALVAGCVRREINFPLAPPFAQIPYSYQASIGLQRRLGNTMAVEADYVFTGERANISNAQVHNINLTYNSATGANYPFSDAAGEPIQIGVA